MADETLTVVERAILDYAMGNFGVIDVLTLEVDKRNITTVQQLEELIGWPLSEHDSDKTEAIWDKFNSR